MSYFFKTNVQDGKQSKIILKKLVACFPAYKFNFDLDDCDKVLRVEGEGI